MNAVRIRPDIAAMEGYHFASGTLEALSERFGRPADQITKMDTNENPYGPSPKALAALADMRYTAPVYPDHRSVHLRSALAAYTGVGAEHILVGAGSDQIIDMTLRLFMNQGEAIINCPPTFTMYSLTAEWMGCRVINVSRHEDFSLDVDAIKTAALESEAKLLFLCTPNNPDGSLIPTEVIEDLLPLPLVVVLDEAYWEFSNTDSFATRVPDVPNLVVLRTFSKWAGLAGMRVGYGVFPLTLMEHLWKIKPPFNVSAAADLAARATLEDLPTMQARIEQILIERKRLLTELAAIPYLRPYPSAANYIYCRVEGVETETIRQTLEAEAILIRYYPPHPFVRITVGRPEDTDRLIAILKQVPYA